MTATNGKRHFEVIDEECVACNLCIEVCPVENCITMVQLTEGTDPRTGQEDRSEIRQLDDASQQSGGEDRGGVGCLSSRRPQGLSRAVRRDAVHRQIERRSPVC